MNDNITTNTPQATSHTVADMWEKSLLRVTDECQADTEVLFCNGAVIGTLGNFSASTGKAKSRKTFNVTALTAAALKNGEVLAYIGEMPEDKRTVLYIDTEQSPYHCQRVIWRILRLAGLPVDSHPDNFKFASLRPYSPEQRLSMIDHAIATTPGIGLVIIDGIRDLMYDINNATEATNVITRLMSWTDRYQIHIHTVLHQNKADDNVRGHIGVVDLMALCRRLEVADFDLHEEQCGDDVSLVCSLVAQLADLEHKILIGYVQVVVLPLGQLSEELGLGK